jgi:hypothetical protein
LLRREVFFRAGKARFIASRNVHAAPRLAQRPGDGGNFSRQKFKNPKIQRHQDTTVSSAVRRMDHSVCVAGATRRGPPAITACCALRRRDGGT